MIRFLIVATFVILFLILSIPVFLIEWIIGKCNPRARDISALRIVQGAFKIVAFLSGVKLTVIGEEHVPKDQPYSTSATTAASSTSYSPTHAVRISPATSRKRRFCMCRCSPGG